LWAAAPPLWQAATAAQPPHANCRRVLVAHFTFAVQVLAKKTADGPKVAIVGVTGAVGQEFLRVSRSCLPPVPCGHLLSTACWRLAAASPLPPLCIPTTCQVCEVLSIARHPRLHHAHSHAPPPQVLHERDFPYSDLKLLASARSAGRTYSFEGEQYTVEELTEDRWAPGGWALGGGQADGTGGGGAAAPWLCVIGRRGGDTWGQVWPPAGWVPALHPVLHPPAHNTHANHHTTTTNVCTHVFHPPPAASRGWTLRSSPPAAPSPRSSRPSPRRRAAPWWTTRPPSA
jgi:hypothetical protein